MISTASLDPWGEGTSQVGSSWDTLLKIANAISNVQRLINDPIGTFYAFIGQLASWALQSSFEIGLLVAVIGIFLHMFGFKTGGKLTLAGIAFYFIVNMLGVIF